MKAKQNLRIKPKYFASLIDDYAVIVYVVPSIVLLIRTILKEKWRCSRFPKNFIVNLRTSPNH